MKEWGLSYFFKNQECDSLYKSLYTYI